MFCKKCGTQLNTGAKFCKKCGAAVSATGPATEQIYDTRIQSHQAGTAGLSGQASQAWPTGQAYPAYQPSPAYDQTPVAAQPAIAGKRPAWIGPVVGIAVVVALIVAGYFWYSRASTGRKLESAMARGNLLKPSGESAFDYYQQLKQSGMSEGARKQIEARLLPMVTSRPLQMITEIASPGNRPETTLADWQEAQTLMAWATEMQPQDASLAARSSYCAGRVAYLSNRKDEAITYWKRAAEQDTSWALPLNGIGLIHSERKNYQTARSFFFEAIRREPQFALPYNNIGSSFLSEKDDAQAESYYRQAIERAPQWPRPHAWLGEIALRRKDYNMAAQEFETVINLDPAGASGIDINQIKQKLEQARQLAAQQAASFAAGEIWLSSDNPEARVWLHPDRWSEKVIPPANHRFSFDGPTAAMVQFADGTEGPIHRNYGSNNEWLKGFRFKGPEGAQVVVRITPQR